MSDYYSGKDIRVCSRCKWQTTNMRRKKCASCGGELMDTYQSRMYLQEKRKEEQREWDKKRKELGFVPAEQKEIDQESENRWANATLIAVILLAVVLVATCLFMVMSCDDGHVSSSQTQHQQQVQRDVYSLGQAMNTLK